MVRVGIHPRVGVGVYRQTGPIIRIISIKSQRKIKQCLHLIKNNDTSSHFPSHIFFSHFTLDNIQYIFLYLPYCIVRTIFKFLIGSGLERTSISSITTDDTLLESFADAAFIVFSTFP